MVLRVLTLFLLAFFTLWLFVAATVLDMGIWLEWGNRVKEYGWITGYRLNAHEHPPLQSLLFSLSAQAGSLLGLRGEFGIKLSFLVCLLGATALVHRWSSAHTAFTIFFYLVFAIASLGLCYADIYFGLPLLLSFYFFAKQRVLAAVACFTLAVLVKYPPLVVAPFVAAYLLAPARRHHLAPAAAIIALMTLPFLLLFGPDVLESLRRATGEHHGWLDAHGLNLWYLVARTQTEDRVLLSLAQARAIPWLAPLLYPKLLVFLFYIPLLLSFLWREKTLPRLLVCAIAAHLCYFTLNTCVHENHLLLSAFLATALFCIEPRLRLLAVLLISAALLNLVIFFGFRGYPFHPLLQVKLLLAAFHVLLFLYLWGRIVFFPRSLP